MGIVVNTSHPSSSFLLSACAEFPILQSSSLLPPQHLPPSTFFFPCTFSIVFLHHPPHLRPTPTTISLFSLRSRYQPPTPFSSPSVAGYPFNRHPRPIIVRSGPSLSVTFTPQPPAVYLSFILDLLFICIYLIPFVLQI